MAARADLETAIRTLRARAADFVPKPFRSNRILNAMACRLDRIRLRRENFVLRSQLRSASDPPQLRGRLIGDLPAIAGVPRPTPASRGCRPRCC